jgi:hypothetical protein
MNKTEQEAFNQLQYTLERKDKQVLHLFDEIAKVTDNYEAALICIRRVIDSQSEAEAKHIALKFIETYQEGGDLTEL